MNIVRAWNKISLVKRIIIGLLVGIVLAIIAPESLSGLSILGSLFVGALKAIAPLLVFFLVMNALLKHRKGQKTNIKLIIVLYIVATLLSAVVAVIISFISPVELVLTDAAEGYVAPSGLVEVIKSLLLRVVDNPVGAIMEANYIGVLAWSVIIALAIKKIGPKESTKNFIENISDALSVVVKWVINFAPFGILGLVYESIATQGLSTLTSYGHLLIVLVGSMLIVVLIVIPIIAYLGMKRNPYPLIFKCLKESGITAFFTRSSAANIPVNMKLCEDLGLDEDTYSISIPLGSTINMSGAAITITVLTLAAANTLGIEVSLAEAILLSFLAAVSACGASGVAGGSLLLIPLAASLFNIPADVAMQVVGIGFIIGIVQDSCETALNSSTDVIFTAVAEYTKATKSK